MAKLPHEPINTPDDFNRESERSGWGLEVIAGPGPIFGANMPGWQVIERATGALKGWCPEPTLAVGYAMMCAGRLTKTPS